MYSTIYTHQNKQLQKFFYYTTRLFTSKKPKFLAHYQKFASRNLIDYARQASIFYQEHYRELPVGAPLNTLPVTSRSLLSAHRDQICIPNLPAYNYRNLSGTSGSTGEPFIFYATPFGGPHLDIEQDYIFSKLWRPLYWNGYTHHRILYSVKMVQLGHKKNQIHPTQLFINPHTLRDDPKQIIESIIKWNPQVISCYSSFLIELAQHVERLGYSDAFSIPYIFFNGEVSTSDQRNYVKKIFGGETLSRYGLEETFWSIACEDGYSPGMIPYYENVIIEILRDDGTACDLGEIGHIIVTDLLNYTHPFIRYDTGDMGHLLTQDGPYITFEIRGRLSHLRVGSITFSHYFANDVITPFSRAIERYQFQKINLNTLRLLIVPLPPFTQQIRSTIIQKVQAIIGSENHFKIEIVPSIPRSEAGKTRPFVDLTKSDL